MKRISFCIALMLVMASPTLLRGQSSFDLRFVAPSSEYPRTDRLMIVVQMRGNGQEFALGTSNLVFSYDPKAFRDPELLAAHHFDGGNYWEMTITEPLPGRVSINIELLSPFHGTMVQPDFMNVAMIAFRRVDETVSPVLNWRTEAPNRTIVFADDETTLIPYGNLSPLASPISGIADRTERYRPQAQLHANYPNPFNPATNVAFRLADRQFVKLTVYDIVGREVATLVSRQLAAGTHHFQWTGIDSRGEGVPSGTYFLELLTGAERQMRPMVLAR